MKTADHVTVTVKFTSLEARALCSSWVDRQDDDQLFNAHERALRKLQRAVWTVVNGR